MQDRLPNERISYEQALRVIGRHLDTEPAYHASILETPDGFDLRSQPARHRMAGRFVHFDWNRLEDLRVFHLAARDLGKKRQHYRGLWSNYPTGHEDCMRALGHILDLECALNVSIDELAEGIAVSYMRPGEEAGRYFDKIHVLYGSDEIERMVQEAQGLRSQCALEGAELSSQSALG